MADISGYLTTIASGVYGRDIKSAIHSALTELNADVSGSKYATLDKITNTEQHDLVQWLMENTYDGTHYYLSGTGVNSDNVPIINLSRDAVRLLTILKRLGLIDPTGSSSSSGSSSNNTYTVYRTYEDACYTGGATNGSPRYTDTDYPNGHIKSILDKLIYKGALKGSSGTGLDMVVNLSQETCRMLVIYNRAGFFDSLESPDPSDTTKWVDGNPKGPPIPKSST